VVVAQTTLKRSNMERTAEPDETGKETDNRTKRRGRKRGLFILFFLVVAGAAGVLLYSRLVLSGYETTDNATVGGDQIVVSSQLLGQIVSMRASQGDDVTKGEILATLDDSILKAQEHQSIVSEELAAENVTLARVKVDQAQNDFDRAVVQLKNNIIPQEQYDHLEQALAIARAGLNIARLQERLAAAQLATVRINLSHTTIASPTDGTVARKWTSPGDVVQPGQPLYTLYDLGHVWVDANFKETQIRNLKVGKPTTMTVDAIPGETFGGTVESIGASTAGQFSLIPPDNASGNYTKVTQRVPVRIAIDTGNLARHRLLPGMSVEVRVETSRE
jgi:membrane fusion protein (multidrug efflux system)